MEADDGGDASERDERELIDGPVVREPDETTVGNSATPGSPGEPVPPNGPLQHLRPKDAQPRISEQWQEVAPAAPTGTTPQWEYSPPDPGMAVTGGAEAAPSEAPGEAGLHHSPHRSSAWRWAAVIVVAALFGGGAGAIVSRAVGTGTTTTVIEAKPGPALVAGMRSIPSIVQKVLPAVVSIQAEGPGGLSALGSTTVQEDEGTGMIITASGEVMTNNHVIAGATRITVTRYGTTKKLAATVIGADPTDDMALLQISGASGLPTVSLGESRLLQVGDAVVAIGNALGLSEGTPTVTSGIISALGRSVQASDTGSGTVENLSDMIQTDAAINPGNSGGPLVDSSGQVIGMNTAVASSSGNNAPAQNIGFAIPSDKIMELLPTLRKGGTVQASNAFLGVSIVSLTPQLRQAYGFVPKTGAVVASVIPGSPAQAAGIRQGDVIVAFDGKPITSAESLVLAVHSAKPGQSARVRLWRGQVSMLVVVTLASTPAG
ncbi:MAG: S1C family serine protease [Acidimicrobiales bacterium]